MPTEEGQDEASRKALEYSAFYRGKVGTVPKVPVRSLEDFSVWYTPGVAAVSDSGTTWHRLRARAAAVRDWLWAMKAYARHGLAVVVHKFI